MFLCVVNRRTAARAWRARPAWSVLLVMRLSFASDTGRVAVLELDATETLDNVCALLEAEFDIPVESQKLSLYGKVVTEYAGSPPSLATLGVTADDMLIVTRKSSSGASASSFSSSSSASSIFFCQRNTRSERLRLQQQLEQEQQQRLD